ncbi:MAG: oxidoreductase [Calditrichia bacterium]
MNNAYSRVTAITRRPLDLTHPKLENAVIDFEHLEKEIGDVKSDHIFCCLGTTIKKAGSQGAFRKVDFSYPLQLAKIGAGNGASQFLLISAMGANPQSRLFYNRVKGEVEEAVSKIDVYGIQIFRPSLLLGRREEFRLGEKLGEFFMGVFSPLMIGNLRKYRPIRAKDVARGMVEIAKTELKGVNIFESDKIQFLCDRLKQKESHE